MSKADLVYFLKQICNFQSNLMASNFFHYFMSRIYHKMKHINIYAQIQVHGHDLGGFRETENQLHKCQQNMKIQFDSRHLLCKLLGRHLKFSQLSNLHTTLLKRSGAGRIFGIMGMSQRRNYLHCAASPFITSLYLCAVQE